jgi:SAM-dependent methyltransferase
MSATAGDDFGNIAIETVAGLRIAGDPPGTQAVDVVYPGAVDNTRQFLAILPETPCEALLELGTGSGVATLAAARFARHAWGVDINPRAVRLAEYNRASNGIRNVTLLESDLYDAVRGMTFDRIIAHPPYVPVRAPHTIFSDGGRDGEEIARRMVAGLPEFLRVGGRFYMLLLGADCEGETFDERIRGWLGPREAEFDLVLVSHSLRTPAEHLNLAAAKGEVPAADLQYWAETWARRRVESLFYGSVLIRRHEGARPAITERAQRGEGFRAAHQDWLLEFAAEARASANSAFLLDSHPTIAPDAELRVAHHVREGRFVPAEFTIASSGPFEAMVSCPAWLAALISWCDGVATWRDLLARAQRDGLIAEESAPDELARILAMLAGRGILRLRERELNA